MMAIDLAPRRQASSRLLTVVGAGAASTWVVVALAHPTSFEGSDTQIWSLVHIAQLALGPLIALGVIGVLRESPGLSATVARSSVVVWAVSFTAYDAMAGVSTGFLAHNGVPSAGHLLMDMPVSGVVGVLAPLAWLITAAFATLASRDAGRSRTTSVALLVSALVAFHAGLPAALGYASLAIAFLTGVRTGARDSDWRLA